MLGVGGLQGSGRSALARALFGAAPFTTGEVTLDGAPVRLRSPRAAMRAGIAYVTEDRKGEGIVGRQSVLDNALLAGRAVLPRLVRPRRPDHAGPRAARRRRRPRRR